MELEEVKARIKEIIGNVAGIDPASIQDGDDVRSDLNLDSLFLVEIGVEVDFIFRLNLSDERYREINSVSEMAELVIARSNFLADERSKLLADSA